MTSLCLHPFGRFFILINHIKSSDLYNNRTFVLLSTIWLEEGFIPGLCQHLGKIIGVGFCYRMKLVELHGGKNRQ